jgi:1-acyl-sn-glycerol-3-phosphate acyltransferase
MDNVRHLLKHSFAYTLLKKYTRFAFNIFYSDIQVKGIENIPGESPVIFAPNHQNALMDALAIIVHIKKQPVFMARADIFSGNITKKLLHLFKIIPVFRIRDGVENLTNNDASFGIAVQCLTSGNCIGIMPEGTDGDKHRLRPLKKGLSRVAFQAQTKLTTNNSVKIVPVGINYSHYQRFRSKIMINFGPAIDINNFTDLYNENPQKAFSDTRAVIASELKKIMLNIDSDQFYQLIFDLKEIAWYDLSEKQTSGYSGRYNCEKHITDCLVEKFNQNPGIAEELNQLTTEYKNIQKRLRLPNEVFENLFPKENLIWDIIRYSLALPFVITGAMFNLIPAIVTRYFSGKIKDSQFVSSYKYAFGLVIFTLYYLLFLCFPLPLLAKVICVATMPVLGILAYDYFTELKIFTASFRFRRGLAQNDTSFMRFQTLRSTIVKKVKEVIQ